MWKWPDEIVKWLVENTPGKTTSEVTELINKQGYDEKYGIVFTQEMIKGAKVRYKIRSGTPSGIPKGTASDLFPVHIRDYILENYKGVGPKNMANALNEKFGTSYTHQQLKTYYRNHSLNSGLDGRFPKGGIPANKGKKMSPEQYEKCKGTMFKKGNIPFNHMEVGAITHTTEGYLVKKISEEGTQRERWEFVHRATWEKHYGPIPEDKMVSFLDGDKDNCDIDNLVLIDNTENLELNRSKLRFKHKEYTRAGVAVAKLKVAARRRKNNDRKHSNEV